MSVPRKGFPLLYFTKSETNGWEIAAKAVGNIPVTNLHAGPECHLLSGLKRHTTVSRHGTHDTSLTLLLAWANKSPMVKSTLFPPRVKSNLKPSHLLTVNQMDIP